MTNASVSELIGILESSADLAARRSAAQQLAQQPDAAVSAAMSLVRATADPDETVREWVVSALEDLGPPPAEDLPSLIELLHDSQPDVVWWSATLLGRLGEDASQAAHPLGELLGDSADSNVRQRAAWALGQLGKSAHDQLSRLQVAAASTDAPLARAAQEALDRIQS